MPSELSNARRALNSLGDGKVEGVAELLRTSQGITKVELGELADFFDHAIPHEAHRKYKLVPVQRKVGNVKPKGVAESKAYESGGRVAWWVKHNSINGKSKNIAKAIGDAMESWDENESGEMPAETTLKRNYYFYIKTNSMSLSHNGVITKMKYPKLKND
jgi:hypothetical protein